MTTKTEFKKGQKVIATSRNGANAKGVVELIKHGPKGAFIEVNHGDPLGVKNYRASQLAAA